MPADFDFKLEEHTQDGRRSPSRAVFRTRPLSAAVILFMSVSYFVEPATGARKGDFNQWTERFTPQTKSVQMKLAQEARLRMLALEIGLPALLFAIGLACLVRAVSWFAAPPADRTLPGGSA
jgi:hypothetical protein